MYSCKVTGTLITPMDYLISDQSSNGGIHSNESPVFTYEIKTRLR